MSQHIRFGTHAPALHSNGWNIIPIPASSKAPRIEGWTAGFGKQQVDAFAANGYAQGNIGLLARFFPAVDIDVLDEECAAAIEQHALQTLGPAPVRIGNRPKRLLAYRTATPFKKLKIYLTAPDGSTRGDDGKDYAVEILGDGQQYVIYGEHPDGFDYEWPDHDGPTAEPPTSLSLVDKEKVTNFLATLPTALPVGWSVREAVSKHRGKAEAEVTFENLRHPLPDWPLERIVGPRWPVQIPPPVATPNSPRQGRGNYDGSVLMASRLAASLSL